MIKKKPPEPSNNGDGEVLSLLKQIVDKQKEQDERLDDLDNKNMRGAAQLRMVNLLYDTDDNHMPGLARLPLRAIKAFAYAMMLDDITHPDVLSGKVTLQHRFRMHYFQLTRSIGGDHLNKGRELAGEQAASEKEMGEQMELGKI